jgi:hypothetical protein
MAIMTSAGSTLGISASLPATEDATGYNALTYTSVGEITDLGEFGTEYSTVNFTALGNRRVRKFKGSYNNGALQLQLGRDTADAGQTLLRTALASDNDYSFKVTLQNGTKLYFKGKVMSYKTQVGSVDQITAASTTVEVVSDVVEV